MVASCTKKIIGKAFLSVSFVAMATPQFAGAQVSSPTVAEEARAAQLMCEVAGICGDLAATESARNIETQNGKSVRAMMSIGTVKTAVPAPSSTDTTAKTERFIVKEPLPRTIERDVWQEASTVRAPVAIKSVDSLRVPALRGELRVNFALGSDKLTDDSMFDIRSFALGVKGLDDQGVYKKFRIEGHADASGTESVNLPLSERRAKAVRDMLVSTGLDADRIEFAGYGSDVPLPGLSPENSLNRRVEAVLVE